MYISRIRLKNWRNFRDIDVELRDRVFVVGPNASGKSNFLDVFRFLRDIAKPGGGLSEAVRLRGGVSKLRCLAARKSPDIEIDVELSDYRDNTRKWRYAIGICKEVRGYKRTMLTYERVWKNGDAKPIIDRPIPADNKDNARLTQTFLEQINTNKDFREITAFFSSIKYIHLIPQLLRNPRDFAYQSESGEDPFGKNFLLQISNTPENVRKSRLNTIQEILQKAVPNLKNLSFQIDLAEGGVPHLETLCENWRPNSGRQREDQLSDGTLRLIALLWSILDGDEPLLLEEPELSLHPGLVRLIPRIFLFMRRRAKKKNKRQLLISTHSDDLLSGGGIQPDEVFFLSPEKEGTTVTSAMDADIKILFEAGIPLGELAISRSKPKNIDQLNLFP